MLCNNPKKKIEKAAFILFFLRAHILKAISGVVDGEERVQREPESLTLSANVHLGALFQWLAHEIDKQDEAKQYVVFLRA